MVGDDKIIACRDCGTEFVFTAGEQGFYAERGFVEPVRCPGCRAVRRRARDMNGAPGGFAGGGGGGMGGSRPMFEILCDQCGQPAHVPFEPRQGRPVYCRDCFQQMRG